MAPATFVSVTDVDSKHFVQEDASTFRNKLVFYNEVLLAPSPTAKLEDHPLSFFRCYLNNIFAATLHCWGVEKTAQRGAA
jgi:hypothetical protein